MVARNPKTKLTYQDYEKTSDDERYELIGGELISMAPAPDRDHQDISMTGSILIGPFVRGRGLGRLYAAPRDVYLTDTDIVQPDLLFISNERLEIDTGRAVRGAPDLVIEIRSPSTGNRDWTVKRGLYGRHGVKEYWVLDPEARTITVMVSDGDSLNIANVFGGNDTLVSSVLEGFTPGVAEFFGSLV